MGNKVSNQPGFQQHLKGGSCLLQELSVRVPMLIRFLAVVVVFQSFAILSLAQLASPPTSAGIPRWYVPNGGGAITRFDKNNAVWFAYSNGVARHGATGGLSKYPSGGGILALTVGPDNAIWADRLGDYIYRIATNGTVTNQYWIARNGGPSSIRGIVSGPDGALWFTNDYELGRISTSGLISHYANGGLLAGGITVGSDGALWYIDLFGHNIGRRTMGGSVTVYAIPGSTSNGCGYCSSISAGPDGAVWFTRSETTKQIGRIDTSGHMTLYSIPTSGAYSITWGHDGAMWFTDPIGKALGRIDMSGHTTYYVPSTTSGSYTIGVVSGVDGNPIFTAWDGTRNYVGKIVLWIPGHVTPHAVTASHGKSFTATLATFSDYELVHSWSFAATIHWGDGSSSKAQVAQTSSSSPRQFTIVGSHTYSGSGNYPIHIDVQEPGDKYSFGANATASIQ
jgi:virginiamycin B lyase